MLKNTIRAKVENSELASWKSLLKVHTHTHAHSGTFQPYSNIITTKGQLWSQQNPINAKYSKEKKKKKTKNLQCIYQLS